MAVKELSPSVRAAAFAALERSYSRRADVPHVDEATELLVLECLERVRFLDARTRLSHHCADETVLNTQENDAQVLHFACLPVLQVLKGLSQRLDRHERYSMAMPARL
jgi:hypothetical protein